MLATTGDGHALRLENAELRTLMPQLRHPALKQLVGANYRGNLPEAVKHSVAALSDNALRIGAVRERQTGNSFPVFMSQLGGRTYEILTQPAADGENSVIGLRALPVRSHAEYMASSGPTAAATRQTTLGPRQALSTAAADSNNNVEGVYNIYHNGQLVYHGQSKNVRQRLGAHLRCLNELRIPVGGYQAAVGRMAGSTKQQRRGEETRRIDQSRAAGRRTGNKQREFEGEAEFPGWDTIREIFEVVREATRPIREVVGHFTHPLKPAPIEKRTIKDIAVYTANKGINAASQFVRQTMRDNPAAWGTIQGMQGQAPLSPPLEGRPSQRRPSSSRQPPERQPPAPPPPARRTLAASPPVRTQPRQQSRPLSRPPSSIRGAQTRPNRPNPPPRPAPRPSGPPRRPPGRPPRRP